jgi:hypothetical protein
MELPEYKLCQRGARLSQSDFARTHFRPHIPAISQNLRSSDSGQTRFQNKILPGFSGDF